MVTRRTYALRLVVISAIASTASLGQVISTPENPSRPSVARMKPAVSLSHLYWHFLLYQNHLDSRAAEQAQKGKDGRLLSSHLQTELGFSSVEFGHIRVSSVRLSAKLTALNERAAVIVAHKDPNGSAQLLALMAERESAINVEVAYLRDALGPSKTATFEAFLIQMFSPKPLAVKVPPSSETSSQGVQP